MSEFDMNSYVMGMGSGGGGGGSGTAAMIADAYSAESTYAVGDYCTHGGKLYVCSTAISTAEEWTEAHWTETVLGDDVTDLKSAVEQISQTGIDASDASSGQVPVADGEGSWDWGSVSGGVSDVQVNGTSVVNQGVANVPIATQNSPGVVGYQPAYGIALNASNQLRTDPASEAQIKAGTNDYKPIGPATQHASTFYGLAKAAGDTTQKDSANAVGTYTESAKSAISSMLSAPETVSGSTPSIPAKAGVSYVCGECSTLTITVPNTGCFDVLFDSGSTPTVLTVTPPTGMTVEWLGNFDPTALSANTTYEINILVKPDVNKCLGVAGAWS